ncbi:AI-2E family transporter, partial [Streptomyces sp. O3]
MSRVPGWLGRLGNGLSRLGERLGEAQRRVGPDDPVQRDHEPYAAADAAGPAPGPRPALPHGGTGSAGASADA